MLALAKIAQEEGGVAVGEYPVPKPGPGEVLIKMQAAGICGTDMQIYNWAQRPGESFQELAAAGIIVLLVVLLTFNAAAILIRQRLQSRLES